MRKLIMVFIALSLVLSGCNLVTGTPLEGLMDKVLDKVSAIIKIAGQGPEKTVEEFAKAVVARDFENASKLFAKDNLEQNTPEVLEKRFGMDNFEQFTVGEVIKQGKTVLVKFSLTKPDVSAFLQAILKKEDYTWKIESIEADPEKEID